MNATTRSLLSFGALSGLCAVLAPTALAQDGSGSPTTAYSVDPEFIRPTFGSGSFVGVDSPHVEEPYAFRYGLLLQYQQNPLVLYDKIAETELENGAIVSNRTNVMLGASMDLSKRFTINLLVPTAYNWGSEVPEAAVDGFGLGDIGAGARVIIAQTRKDTFAFGARAGLIIPTGRQLAFIGEDGVRLNIGLPTQVRIGQDFSITADPGVTIRDSQLTDEDFEQSSELQLSGALRYALPEATRTALNAQILSRAGFSNFFAGGAENSLEALGGVSVYPSNAVTIDLAAGRGLTEGYGTSDLRVIGMLTIQRVPPKPEPVIIVEGPPPPPPPPPPPEIVDIVEPLPPPPEGTIARLEFNEIKIYEQPKFQVDTAIILPESVRVIDAVVEVMNDNAQIGHLVVEGHASKEGTSDHNYELSESRAEAIYRAMIERGVHPNRLSYRGQGEVIPLKTFETCETQYAAKSPELEACLAPSRRVEFHVVSQYAAIEQMPQYPNTFVLPWNDKAITTIQPKKPAPPPVDAGPTTDEFGMPINGFESGDETGPMDVGTPAPAPKEDKGRPGTPAENGRDPNAPKQDVGKPGTAEENGKKADPAPAPVEPAPAEPAPKPE